MAILDIYTDKSIKWKHPAESIPVNNTGQSISTVKRTLQGDAVLLSLQLPASEYRVHVSMTSLSDMRLPSVECSYSYTTFAKTDDRAVTHMGSTSNTVSSKPVNVKAGESVSCSLKFTNNGGTINVALRGASHGIFTATVEVYKVV
jgi:hypothetical protein